LVLGWSIGVAIFVYDGIKDAVIAKRQRTTQGTVTAHEPANHDRYGYVFSVEGKSYSGWDMPRKNEVSIGKQVLVYYDPSDPTRNALTDFEELCFENFGPIPLMVFAIGGVTLFIFRARLKKLRIAKPAV